MTDSPGSWIASAGSPNLTPTSRISYPSAVEERSRSGRVRASGVPGRPRVGRRERARTARRRVHGRRSRRCRPRSRPRRTCVWERVADGTLSTRAPQAAVQGVLLPRQVVHERVRLDRLERARRRRRSISARSEHFVHWAQNLADETGFAGDRNHVDMKIDWAHQLGITDDELLDVPGHARDRSARCSRRSSTCAARTRRAWPPSAGRASASPRRRTTPSMMYEGMRDHYGIEVENFKVHAYAEEDHGTPGRLPAAPGRGDGADSSAASAARSSTS